MIAQKPLNVNAVASHFYVSRTAIYKHVKILTECGLLVIKQHGRERFYEAKLKKLNEVSDWIEPYKKFWNIKLDSLATYLSKSQTKNKSLSKNKKNDKRKRPIANRKNV
jgi:predicted transcriptional regulator